MLRGGPGRARRARAGTDLLVVHLARPEGSGSSGGPAGASPDPPPTRSPRVGFVVSKAVGGSVVRHRVVRRLRAQVAARLDRLPEGSDLVVRALPPSATASSSQLGEALDAALAQVMRSGRRTR